MPKERPNTIRKKLMLASQTIGDMLFVPQCDIDEILAQVSDDDHSAQRLDLEVDKWKTYDSPTGEIGAITWEINEEGEQFTGMILNANGMHFFRLSDFD